MHLDNSDNVMLIILDPSAVIDTIDHEILLKWMEKKKMYLNSQ